MALSLRAVTAKNGATSYTGQWASGFITPSGADVDVTVTYGVKGILEDSVTQTAHVGQSLNYTGPANGAIISLSFQLNVANTSATVDGYFGESNAVGIIASQSGAVSNAGVITRVTTLPTAPSDLQQVMLDLNSTFPGVEWLCTYNSSTGYWDATGPELFAEVPTSETTTSATYVDLATPGPSITLPNAGDYLLRWGGTSRNDTVNGGAQIAVKFGAAATNDADAAIHVAGASINEFPPGSRGRRYAGLTAAEVLKLQYRADSGGGTTATFLNRWLTVQPIRVK